MKLMSGFVAALPVSDHPEPPRPHSALPEAFTVKTLPTAPVEPSNESFVAAGKVNPPVAGARRTSVLFALMTRSIASVVPRKFVNGLVDAFPAIDQVPVVVATPASAKDF